MWRVKPLDAILASAEKKSLTRTLGPVQLTLLGVGAIIGTGIFVLTSEAAQKAGPGMMWSFVIAAAVCAVAALCYSEIASMVPVSGSAYTYTYAVMGEVLAWMVGWALILEYAVAASAVSVGWSGYFIGLLQSWGVTLPQAIAVGPYAGGIVNLPALLIALLITGLLMLGTSESARVNAVLVAIKVTALTVFIVLTLPVINGANFTPFTPNGWFGDGHGAGLGVFGAAASIFFAYVGFDAVSTAAEETKNPQRNVPIGLIASLGICTIFYLLVAAGAIGAVGAQPLVGPGGEILHAGSSALAAQCATFSSMQEPLVCSREALAHVLRVVGHERIGDLIGIAAFLPVGKLADISNSGTLFAFFMVAIAVMILRVTQPNRHRPFRTPLIWVIAPLAVIGTLGLFFNLPTESQLVLPIWGAIGLVVYFAYGYRKSHVGRGLIEVHEADSDAPPPPVPPIK